MGPKSGLAWQDGAMDREPWTGSHGQGAMDRTDERKGMGEEKAGGLGDLG